jgi:hypothetical protein
LIKNVCSRLLGPDFWERGGGAVLVTNTQTNKETYNQVPEINNWTCDVLLHQTNMGPLWRRWSQYVHCNFRKVFLLESDTGGALSPAILGKTIPFRNYVCTTL